MDLRRSRILTAFPRPRRKKTFGRCLRPQRKMLGKPTLPKQALGKALRKKEKLRTATKKAQRAAQGLNRNRRNPHLWTLL